MSADVVLLSEDASVLEILKALVAKGEGKTVRVIKKTRN